MSALEQSLVRLPGGVVLLTGAPLADVVRALEVAQVVSRSDGITPSGRWLALLRELRVALAEVTARPGRAAVPQLAVPAWSFSDQIGTSEVADMLGCKPRNVRDLRERGVLESGQLVGGRLLFARSEVSALLVNRRAIRRTLDCSLQDRQPATQAVAR